MANRHFGKIGDIWKHLPLAEILTIEKPIEYWETNAGSALYPLTHSPERDYGVFTFYKNAKVSEILRDSKYFALLDSFEKKDEFPTLYPGSPFIALSLLKDYAKHYLFCDIDVRSLETIREAAKNLDIKDEAVETINDDGATTIMERAKNASINRSDIFIHIDPCGGFVGEQYISDNPFDKRSQQQTGPVPIDCFFDLSREGFKTFFWHGFLTMKDREIHNRKIDSLLDHYRKDSNNFNFYKTEILLSAIDDPNFKFDPGVRGCGIICSNLSDQSFNILKKFGSELEELYREVSFSDGTSGKLSSTISIVK
jgi:23S rRNA (adenine2030-N6)-methyltransferase